MGKFRVTAYNPRADSSPRTEHWRPGFQNDPPGYSGVVIDRQPADGFRVCPCGCRRQVAGKATFAMGHDMKLKGILIRAHLAGSPIHVLTLPDPNGKTAIETRTAREEAQRFSTEKYDWVSMLVEAELKQGADVRDAIERAEREVTERALGPQPGQRALLKLGRWEYTGYVLAVYREEGAILYEYVDKKGHVQQVRKESQDAS